MLKRAEQNKFYVGIFGLGKRVKLCTEVFHRVDYIHFDRRGEIHRDQIAERRKDRRFAEADLGVVVFF